MLIKGALSLGKIASTPIRRWLRLLLSRFERWVSLETGASPVFGKESAFESVLQGICSAGGVTRQRFFCWYSAVGKDGKLTF